MPGLNINPEYMGEERRELSLLELNNLVRGAVSEAFPGTCWVRESIGRIS